MLKKTKISNGVNKQKGVSLYLAVVIMVILLTIVLGAATILVSQIRMIKEMENSVVAFYAADTGIERVLEVIINKGQTPVADYVGLLDLDGDGEGTVSICPDNMSDDGDACYYVEVFCCNPGVTCSFEPGECPAGLAQDPNCKASLYCVKSSGIYKDRRRAIEVGI